LDFVQSSRGLARRSLSFAQTRRAAKRSHV
jgi:hypothetical protein